LWHAQRLRDDVRDGDRPVVAEALADRAVLLRVEVEALRLVNCVSVLVQYHLAVLGVVDATLAEAQLVLRMVGLERVVSAELVDPGVLWLVVDRRQTRAEAE